MIGAKRTQKKLKSPDKEKMNDAIHALEDAIAQDNEYAMKTAGEDLEQLLRAAGKYVDYGTEDSGNDDGSFDVG